VNVAAAGGRFVNAPYPAARESNGISQDLRAERLVDVDARRHDPHVDLPFSGAARHVFRSRRLDQAFPFVETQRLRMDVVELRNRTDRVSFYALFRHRNLFETHDLSWVLGIYLFELLQNLFRFF